MKGILFEIYKDGQVRIGYTTRNIEIEDYEKLIPYIREVIANMKGMIPRGE